MKTRLTSRLCLRPHTPPHAQVLLHLQFTPTGEIAELNQRLGQASSSVTSVLAAVKTLNLSLPTLEGTSVAMNALLVSCVFATRTQLLAQVRKHYKKQYLRALSPLETLASSQTSASVSGPLSLLSDPLIPSKAIPRISLHLTPAASRRLSLTPSPLLSPRDRLLTH